MPKRIVSSNRVFKGSPPFAQATVSGGFMFVCCTVVDRKGHVSSDVSEQTQQCLDNIGVLVEEAGGTKSDILKCTGATGSHE